MSVETRTKVRNLHECGHPKCQRRAVKIVSVDTVDGWQDVYEVCPAHVTWARAAAYWGDDR